MVDEVTRAGREATVRAHLDAENRKDGDGVLATFAHPRYEVIGTGRTYDGRDDVVKYLHDTRVAFPDLHKELISIHQADDVVVAEYWMSATHEGRFGDVEPSGQRFRVRVCAVYEFEGTQLTCERMYFDTGLIARQLS